MPTVFLLVFQDFRPVKNICAHLNAFHVYANDTSRFVEANHYCAHLNEGEMFRRLNRYATRSSVYILEKYC